MKHISESLESKTMFRAALGGGKILQDGYAKLLDGQLAVSTNKDDKSYNLVTETDLLAEQAIVASIRESFPDHEILGEEGTKGNVAAEHLWVIDPLDGTNNFAHGMPHFAISIGYYRAGKAELGAIYNPLREEWFVCQRNGGAWWNDRRVRVKAETQLNQVLVATGFFYDRGAMMRATLEAVADFFTAHIHGIRRCGAASLDLAYVGCGIYGAFFEFELAPWDFAAGRLFVEEAGGLVTTCTGENLPLERTHLLASNGSLHAASLEIVNRHLPKK
jgi:myo-inositol-1(or 4)-monophosphatase